jgi:hypothetical protein
MGKLVKALVGLGAIAAIGYLFRTRVVHVLTRTTGTWVGTPDAGSPTIPDDV